MVYHCQNHFIFQTKCKKERAYSAIMAVVGVLFVTQ